MDNDIFVRNLRLEDGVDFNKYPFNIAAVEKIEKLFFDQPVTFLIGENGSGKSTILEALAVATGFNAEGGTKNYSFSTSDTVSELHNHISVVRNYRRERQGFFLRAESFYNVSTESERLHLQYGDKSLHEQSHGESFLALANHRFGPQGLYILDEPEAALSPKRQMAFMVRMNHLVQQGSQFIIATHSPILMAYDPATIYELNGDGFQSVDYEDTEHHKLTLDFLSNYRAYASRLFNDNGTANS